MTIVNHKYNCAILMTKTNLGAHKVRILRLAMAQINTTVGDIEGNTNKILDYIKEAKSVDADVYHFRNWQLLVILLKIYYFNNRSSHLTTPT